MVPFLLPAAILIIVIVGATLLVFLRAYRMARPGTALLVTKSGEEPYVLFEGGAVAFLSVTVESLDLAERSLTVSLAGDRPSGDEGEATAPGPAPTEVEVRLRPEETAEDVLAIARSMGIASANDSHVLAVRVRRAVREAMKSIGDARPADDPALAEDLRAEVQRRMDGFRIVACNPLRHVAAAPREP